MQVKLLVEANNGVYSALIPLHVRDGRGTLQPPRAPMFSDMVSTATSTSLSSRKGLGAICKKGHLRKQNTDPGNNGEKSTRSLTGLQRDAEVVFVPKGTAEAPLLSPASRPGLLDFLRDDSVPGDLWRAIREPDLGVVHPDSGLGEHESTTRACSKDRASAASHSETPSRACFCPCQAGSIALPCESVVDSIGSAGSLAQRQSVLPWEDVEDVYYEEDEEDEEEEGNGTPLAIVVFLPAHELAEYVDLFSREKVNLDALTLLGEEDLKTMDVPLGPRKKLLRAVEQRRVVFEDPGEVADSRP
ncbi:hypothetical protein HPB52_002046 [Rhipicephalus sanguineus]|uniref:SAM domain-containing protein n=1 Tax=Rhipicephalus sanguineus TaxID=34632 RepID=A0A9D4PHI4_RHISA|nr:hypothetical protein HPB52_002046 [Rhipicephalus sanguineus]